ncbi:MAG TPA: hypothetical protein VHN37_15535 [Actinomycetota bacterium]|nr:hypothetical protein [Actinomycetota bacterium]
MNELYVPDEGLLWLTAAAIAGWFLFLASIWTVRYPRRPRPDPETTELGAETPAVANLLAHRFKATRDAVPATLVDLAARGLVEIEDRGIGDFYCRVTGRSAELLPYERLLLDHLRDVSSGGVVPAAALTTGPQDRSKAWWGKFRDEVVADTQSRGLSRDLWDKRVCGALFLGCALILLLFELAIGFNDPEQVVSSGLMDGVMVAGLAAFCAAIAAAASKRQTSTDAGDRAAARWLGVKRALEESPSFELLPPSGVVVWERHLAYAAALGAAPQSIRSLPMGAESDTEAWTASSGEWRKVRVRYPRLRPGWGRHPLLALTIGGIGTYLGYNIIRVATRDIGFHDTWLAAAGTVATALGIVVLARSLPQVALGFLDLFSKRLVTGTVLRARTRWSPVPYLSQRDDSESLRFFVAIDDGRSESLTAYRVKPSLYRALPQGSMAELEVTPNLGYVRRPSA